MTDSPIGWVAKHIDSYVRTDGRSGGRYYGHDSLLLTTRGRRTGVPRRTALFYWRDADRYVVVASNGGIPTHPAWYLNLRADPEVVVQVGADVFVATARPAAGEERARLWTVVVEGFPKYARYREKVGRDLPIVVLRPR